jgi:hypothetical protein
MVLHRIAVVSAFAVSATAVLAQTASPQQGREIPAYTLPVPEDISPQIRALVAAPLAPWDIHPKSIAEWKELVAKVAAAAKTLLLAMREKLGVKLEQATIGGVNVFVLTPQTIAPENQNRVFVHFHGGAYVINPGEPGTREGILMAGFGHVKVISVDYRTSSDPLHATVRHTGLVVPGDGNRPALSSQAVAKAMLETVGLRLLGGPKLENIKNARQ